MPKRRANGEGNIRKRKDGRWEGRYTVGRDSETGKAIIKNVLGKTQAEVKEKLKKAIEENVGIDYGRAKTYTVGSWLEVWMENYARVKLRPSTFKTSQGFLKNHIKPQIGGIPLADLTSLDLQRFYKHLLDGGRVDRIEAKKKPKGLAPKTVRNIHQMIGSAYNLAITYIRRYLWQLVLDIVEHDSIDSGEFDTTPVPAPAVTKKPPVTTEQRQEIKKELTGAPAGAATVEQVSTLKSLLKKLMDIDAEQEQFVQTIAMKTEGFSKIEADKCDALIEGVNNMLAGYEMKAAKEGYDHLYQSALQAAEGDRGFGSGGH